MSWDELVAVALVGTDRRAPGASVPEGSPPALASALAERGPEDRLLGAAAAWTVARRAGAAASEPVTVAQADSDERPLAGGDALRVLLYDHPELLPEWLALAERGGRRPPPELLPGLLDHAARDPSLHADVAEAAGPLGRWLAERAPRWAFVRDDADVWALGGRAERRALLARLRHADPERARELLATTFAEETWEDREAFVLTLADGLSDADEPFLERALDDGRRAVRDAAAALLARLPRSRFAARMAARAAPLLQGRHVELPGEPDEAGRRDGVPARGSRAARLRTILAATPLATWTGPTPPDDLADVVRAGWADAAIAQSDPGWARALYAVTGDPELLAVLPRDEGEQRAASAENPFAAALALPDQWGPGLSTVVVEWIGRTRAAGVRGPNVVAAAYQLDPAIEVEPLRELGGRDLWELCDIVAIRAAMLRELG